MDGWMIGRRAHRISSGESDEDEHPDLFPSVASLSARRVPLGGRHASLRQHSLEKKMTKRADTICRK